MATTEFVFGYGSLMSEKGLTRDCSDPNKEFGIVTAYIASVKGRRGFAKYSCGKLAMNIEPDLPMTGAFGKTCLSGFIEGLLIEIPQVDFPNLAKREGYPCRGDNLLQQAQGQSKRVIELLPTLTTTTSLTCCKYEPFRVNFKNIDAVISIAGCYPLKSITDALCDPRVTDPKKQLEYYVECILGGVHGIDVRDLLALLNQNLPIYSQVNAELKCLVPKEAQFTCRVQNAPFPKLKDNLKASGLLDKFPNLI